MNRIVTAFTKIDRLTAEAVKALNPLGVRSKRAVMPFELGTRHVGPSRRVVAP